MIIYSIQHEGDSKDFYSLREFERGIWSPFCREGILKNGYVIICKEMKRSRRWGRVVSYVDEHESGLEIQWYDLEKEDDGAY